jgi:hypothetical protein
MRLFRMIAIACFSMSVAACGCTGDDGSGVSAAAPSGGAGGGGGATGGGTSGGGGTGGGGTGGGGTGGGGTGGGTGTTPPPQITGVSNLRPILGAPPNAFLARHATTMRIDGTGFDAAATVLVYVTAAGPSDPVGTGVLGTPSVTAVRIEGSSPIDASLVALSTPVTVRVTNPDGQLAEASVEFRALGALAPTDVSVSVGAEIQPSVCIDPLDPLHVAVVAQAGASVGSLSTSIRLQVSVDGGLNVVTHVLGALEDGFSLLAQRSDPCAAFDAFGNLFLCYRVRVLGTLDAIVLLQSGDGGSTWLGPLPTLGIGLAGTLGAPRLCTGPLATGPGQACCIAWTNDLLDDVVVCGGVTLGLGLLVSAPLVPIVVDDAPLLPILPDVPCAFPSPCILPDGSLVLSWLEDASPDTIRCDRDADGLFGLGAGFGADVLVGTTAAGLGVLLPSCPDFGAVGAPLLDCIRAGSQSGRLVLAYVQASAGQTDCVCRTSDDGGATWSVEVLVHGSSSADQHLPALATDAVTGAVVITYFDASADPFELLVERRSCASADGISWTTPLVISAGASLAAAGGADTDDYLVRAGVAVHAGLAYGAWCDNSNADGENPDGAGGAFDILVTAYMQLP